MTKNQGEDDSQKLVGEHQSRVFSLLVVNFVTMYATLVLFVS